MKLPLTIHDLRLGTSRRAGRGRRPQAGIALVITLIMLAVTVLMAVAFLALARRERGSVSTTTDTTTARLAAETGLASAEAQIAASMLSGFTGLGSSNAFNLHLLVSTNYINPLANGGSNPTNVNYLDAGGNLLTGAALEQNISNLWFLPRPPVFVPVPTNVPGVQAYDFRYYLDLNENGRFDANGMQAVISDDPNFPYYNTNGVPIASLQPANVLSNFFVGDPEWVGVLEHPDAPHGPNNHFVSRYAFIAVPVGNTLDLNYIHNDAYNVFHGTHQAMDSGFDGFSRNQGVGSWELNLAAFLADLDTNVWDSPSSGGMYNYQTMAPTSPGVNGGAAFSDALALLKYRYNGNYNNVPSARQALNNFNLAVNNQMPNDGIDAYSDGPLQTTLNTNADWVADAPANAWSGGENVNHFFTLWDFFDTGKLGLPPNYTFTNHLRQAGAWTVNGRQPSYDRYAFYRMLDELGTDSSADEGKLNLNYSNAVVSVVNGTVTGVSVVTGAETNLVRWNPTNFFLAAADKMLRLYTTNWYLANYRGFTNAFGVTAPFGVGSIPVWVSNRFVYTPAVNRLLQLAANMYDATTNGNFNLPHVYRPLFKRVNNGFNNDIFIIGYTEVTSVSGSSDLQLGSPYDVTQLLTATQTPIVGSYGLVNVYGVPWIIGAKKGLPGFNQMSLVTAAQVTRKLEVTRTSYDPAVATFGTNQMYIMQITNGLGISFWNSYNTAYPRPLTVYVSDSLTTYLTNNLVGTPWSWTTNFQRAVTVNAWPGSQWSGTAAASVPQDASFLTFNWPYTYLGPTVINLNNGLFDLSGGWSIPPPWQLPQYGIAMTNYLQAFILDGNNVIDYVQLRGPISTASLNQALADPDYGSGNDTFSQWSTNVATAGGPPYGAINQLWVSGHPSSAPVGEGKWSQAPTPMGDSSPAGEAAYYNGFFTPSFQYPGPSGVPQTYVVHQLAMQAPYTPSRTVFSSFLLQANDPLVHYLATDLDAEVGATASWGANHPFINGYWTHVDDIASAAWPTVPTTPLYGRYQPWGRAGQMHGLSGGVDGNVYNQAYKDPLVWGSDNWDFPTNLYPSVGWIGRVHRGTPWQTVYLKSTNVLVSTPTLNGPLTWAAWTGDIQTNFYSPNYNSIYVDAVNHSPQQDYWLFNIFTTRFNDNGAHGTLPVNVGAGRGDGGLAAWSALFSGMVVLSNSAPAAGAGLPLTYTYATVNPAGIDRTNSALWYIVNDRLNGINATRANTNLFPYQTFVHAGQVLATPALSTQSRFLNLSGTQPTFGINDEMYEWLPQQMMGLVRSTEQRYALYCLGQALRPAPGGTVLNGPYFQLVTNYQVMAESAIRAVIRVDNANTSQPHAVVESYNTLPAN